MSPQSMLRRALTFNHLPKSVRRNGLRGRRPYANNAAAAAEEPNPGGNKVRGRRLSKKDLQALVESFVNEYRAMNEGKFPPFAYTQQQVGGGYYRVRAILQELQYIDKMSPSCGGIEHSLGGEGVRGSESLTEVGGVSARTVSEVEYEADLSVATPLFGGIEHSLEGEGVRGSESLTEVGGVSARTVSEVEDEADLSVATPLFGGIEHSLEGEGVRGSEALTEVRDASARIVSEVEDKADVSVTSDGCLEAKEESQTFAAVEVLSDEVITPERGSDLDVMHSIGKMDAEESSSKDPDIVEEQKNNQYVSIAPGCEMLRGTEVISHSHDKSQDSKMEESQAVRHDYIIEEKHLVMGETTTASPSSDDTEDITKPEINDLECKMKQQEEVIPEADRFDSITAEKHLPLEADKLSQDLTGRPADDAEPPKTTLWGAMKSLADGIISIFRK